MKRGTPEHPKMVRLAKILGIEQWAAVGLMEWVWHFTAKHSIGGDIGRWTDADIACAVHWEGDPERLINSLVGAGWLDRDPVHRLLVHDWHEHADEAVKKTLRNRKQVFFTFRENSGLPEPEPEPEPEPLPEPLPLPKPEPMVGSDPDPETDQKNLPWEGARNRAEKILQKLGGLRPNSQNDWPLLIGSCALVETGLLPEYCLVDSVEATKAAIAKGKGGKHPNAWAYLRTCLRASAKKKGKDFDALLALARPPTEFSSPLGGEVLKLTQDVGKIPE